MTNMLSRSFSSALVFLPPALAWTAPIASAARANVLQQADVAVFIDRQSNFVLVTHQVGVGRAAVPATPDQFDQHSRGTNVERAAAPHRLPEVIRRQAYLGAVSAAEARYALPAGLLDAVVWTESRYNPYAVSTAGAVGLGQLMSGTAREMGVRDRLDALANLDGAGRYLRLLIDKFGLVHLALAAYNAGPAAVERARGIPLNGQTPRYVRDVLRRWKF